MKTPIPNLVIIVTICASGAYLFTGCAKNRPTAISSAELEADQAIDESLADGDTQAQGRGIIQKILSFNLEGYRDNGEKKWELKGTCANILSSVIKLEDITVKAHADEGDLTLKANAGLYDKATKDICLEGQVVGNTSDGTRIFTDKVVWKQKEESVETDAPVRVEKENIISTGKGATANPGLEQISLLKDVVVKIDKDPETIVTCDGPLVVEYGKNIATLKNNVKILDQKGAITSDEMKILFDPKTKKATRAVAIGNVRIQRENNYTTSERAIYTVKDEKVRLLGKPKVVVFTEKENNNAFVGN